MILDVVVGFITGLSVGMVLMAWLMQPAKRGERLPLPPVKRRRSTAALAAVPKRSHGGS